jgi:ferrous iron transport protein B
MPDNLIYNNIALVGNPNTGKSSLFNVLTGLNQKVGNYSGVTVDKKKGSFTHNSKNIELTDLPGVYSIYPKSIDERVVLDLLTNEKNPEFPQALVAVVDASNLRRSMLMLTQIADLDFPLMVVLTMNDVAHDNDIYISEKKLATTLGCIVLKVNSRTKQGIEELKNKIVEGDFKKIQLNIPINELDLKIAEEVKETIQQKHTYKAVLAMHHHNEMQSLSYHEKKQVEEIVQKNGFNSIKSQARENIRRYELISTIYDTCVVNMKLSNSQKYSSFLDKALVHPIWGYVILLTMIFTVIQLVFTVSEYPMGWIESIGGSIMDFANTHVGDSNFMKLITNGLLAGIFGVLVFIPQISLLFLFLGILEETGYMARAVFITDKLMRKVGMNGRSVIPLFSGVACAVPAIMATRTIDNPKDRLITILVTPLISCSARIPVYTILIGLFVPDTVYLGLFTLKGLVFMGLYFFGFFVAIICSYALKKIINIKHSSFFVMELPSLKVPNWYNVFISIVEKVKSFVFDAGKTIVAVSIVLAFLSFYGPSKAMKEAEASVERLSVTMTTQEKENLLASKKLEASFAGYFGKMLEPAIAPMGYDWKIGIALLTSFAAREVFVPTISTIYNLGTDEENDGVIIQKLRNEKDPVTGKPLYGTALCVSLLIFYALSMQCVSTLATTKRETKSWKWPVIQFVGLTMLAYLGATLAYQILI